MTTDKNASAPTVKVSRTLTDSEHATVLNALDLLHGILGSAEFGKSALPHFDTCTLEQQGFILSRTLDAIKAKDAEVSRERTKGAKGKIDALCHGARVKRVKAWRAACAFVSENPDAAEFTNTVAPTSTYITVADAEECFPEGTVASDIPALLLKMGYKLASSPTKKEEDRRVVVSINAEHLSVGAPPVVKASDASLDLAAE